MRKPIDKKPNDNPGNNDPNPDNNDNNYRIPDD